MFRFLVLSFVLFITSAAAATDVRVFGAQGNGSADDTDAIQNAINACPADGTVTFSPGNYLVRGLSLKSSCTYTGFSGSAIILSAQNRFIFDASERSNIHITGLAFDGNGKGGAFIAQGYAPIRNLRIDNCEFRNVVSSAFFPANLTIV